MLIRIYSTTVSSGGHRGVIQWGTIREAGSGSCYLERADQADRASARTTKADAAAKTIWSPNWPVVALPPAPKANSAPMAARP